MDTYNKINLEPFYLDCFIDEWKKKGLRSSNNPTNTGCLPKKKKDLQAYMKATTSPLN